MKVVIIIVIIIVYIAILIQLIDTLANGKDTASLLSLAGIIGSTYGAIILIKNIIKSH